MMVDKEVVVTSTQADAARMIVDRDSANGRTTPEPIQRIANATVKPETVIGQATVPTPQPPPPEPAPSAPVVSPWRRLMNRITGRSNSDQ